MIASARCKLTLVIMALLLGGCAQQTLKDGSRISDAKAIEVYQGVAKTLGIAVEEKAPTVSGPKPMNPNTSPGGPTLEIRTKLLTVEADVQTGKVILATDERVTKQQYARCAKLEADGRQVVPTHDVKAVIEAAEKWVKALGQELAPDLKLREVEFDPEQGCWRLDWNRYISGFPFEDEWVTAILDDPDLKLAFYHNTVTNTTCPTEVKVPLDKARATALKWVSKIIQLDLMTSNTSKKEDYEPLEDKPPHLCVVYTGSGMNLSLIGGPSPENAEPKVRLVYRFHFVFSYIGKGIHVSLPPMYVDIDAATGDFAGAG